jgi:hypothetical protein
MNRRNLPPGALTLLGWLWLLGLFLVAVGARLWLIHSFGTSLPFWDQWEEARIVYVPFFEGRLSLSELFQAHNEHRMFFNRFYDLGLLLLNGQWDNQVETVANTLIYCAGIAVFGWILARRLGRSSWPVIALVLMLVLVLPFGWENTVGGFHSQVYTSTLFSLFVIWLLGCHDPRTAPWGWGVLVGIGSLCTPTSGIISSAAIFGLTTLKILREPASWRRHWPTLAVSLVLVALGLALRVEVPHHRALMAHSIIQFLISLGKYLAWPWIVVPPFALFNMLPLSLLAWFYLRERQARLPAEEIVLGIGLWAVLQAAATAYARGAQEFPQWRYMDSTCFVMITNALSIVLLLRRFHAANPRTRALSLVIFSVWGIACAAGLSLLSLRALSLDLPERRFYFRCQLQNMRAFMATGDIRVFDNKPKPYLPLYEGDPLAPQPKHAGEKLLKYMDNPWIRPLLPACVRDPLKVVPESVTGFVTNGPAIAKPRIAGELCWSSYTALGTTNTGRFESQPVPRTRFPYLEFRIAGDLGKPGLSLSLLDLSSGKATQLKPSQPPGHTWQTCRVRAPRGDFKILAVDESTRGWLAFQPPRELARLSWAVDQAVRLGVPLFFIGLALYGIGLVLALRGRTRAQAEASTSTEGTELTDQGQGS